MTPPAGDISKLYDSYLRAGARKEIRVANAIEIQVEVNGALADLVKELEGQLDTATEALAWYADGTNYIAQVDARGRKQRPIMVLKAHRAEVALRKIGRWPVQP